MRAVDNGFFCVSEEKALRRKVEKLELDKSKLDTISYELDQIKKAMHLSY